MQPLDPETVQRHVGRRIAELRGERGLTQAQAAEQLGVSTRYVQSVEGGAQNLGLESLVVFANLYRVPLAELVRRPSSMRARRGRPSSR